ncbi:hypothetical protein BpHYR1_042935 [Brachionus plicatilis]|uniref:Uncharacterized protein n=1 Tax=Brachionus plicatilis TaxID=10195 RepID=A0A3M7SW07_BRAPC|nr:hypothetical protein BpHYR1_042935 [Brachionus plicatilis]
MNRDVISIIYDLSWIDRHLIRRSQSSYSSLSMLTADLLKFELILKLILIEQIIITKLSNKKCFFVAKSSIKT